MSGDGSKRSILDTVAEETEQHIQSIQSQRWIYPRRSIDRVVTNCDKKGDESKSTSHVQFRQRVLNNSKNSLNDVEKLVESRPHGPSRRDHDHTEQTESSDTRCLFLLPNDREPPGQVILDPEGAMNKSRERQPTAGPTMDKIESFVTVPRAQEEGKEGVFGGKEEDDRELSQGDEACAVRVVE